MGVDGAQRFVEVVGGCGELVGEDALESVLGEREAVSEGRVAS